MSGMFGGEVGGVRRGDERRIVRISIFDSKSRRFKKERKKSQEKSRVGWKEKEKGKKVTRLGKLGGPQQQSVIG
jgi:hypothetical protein